MTDLPKFIKEKEECFVCSKIGKLQRIELDEDRKDPRVEAHYECECGYKFGYGYTNKMFESYKKYLEDKKD